MGVLDKMIDASFRGNKKETQEERRKRLIEEGKATESDFYSGEEPGSPVLDWDMDESGQPVYGDGKRKKKPGSVVKK